MLVSSPYGRYATAHTDTKAPKTTKEGNKIVIVYQTLSCDHAWEGKIKSGRKEQTTVHHNLSNLVNCFNKTGKQRCTQYHEAKLLIHRYFCHQTHNARLQSRWNFLNTNRPSTYVRHVEKSKKRVFPKINGGESSNSHSMCQSLSACCSLLRHTECQDPNNKEPHSS